MVSLGWEMERGMLAGEEKKEEEEKEKEEGGEASVTDEEESESDTELAARRKVSFADAFGLDLVSVKEFDEFVVDLSGSGVNDRAEAEVAAPPRPRPHPQAWAVNNHLSCLFSVPADAEELRRRLRKQKVELESVELLPGTAILRGVVRVANLCYRKSVHVRVSPDAWRSHFELPAVYVPGSSDRETDRFAFLYALETPTAAVSGKPCTRLEFCLRYETEVGTFWANNGGLNFVLFCHQKGRREEATHNANPREAEAEVEEEEEEEEGGPHLHLHGRRKQQKGGKRSCLKANRREDAEDETCVVTDKATAKEDVVAQKDETASRKIADTTETQRQDGDLLVDGGRSGRKAAWQSRGNGVLGERDQAPAGDHHPHHHHQEDRRLHPHRHQAVPVPGGVISHGVPQAPPPTYHQIPLSTLDWRSEEVEAEAEALCARGGTIRNAKPSKGEQRSGSAGDPKNFLDGGGGGGGGGDRHHVPESVWLQRATSISPPEQPVGGDHRHRHRHEETKPSHETMVPPQRQPRAAVPEGPPVSVPHVAELSESQERRSQRAGGRRCTGSRDNVPLAPEGSSVKELATTTTATTTTTTAVDNNVSADDGSRTQRPKCVASETRRETRDTEGMRGEKVGGGGGGGGDRGVGGELLSGPAGASITSSGETAGTTETTAAAAVDSQNASDVIDKIWRGAPGPSEGLPQSRDEDGDDDDKDEAEDKEVRGTVCERDALAFREPFKGQGTKNGAGLVSFPFRKGEGGEGGGGGGGAGEGRLTMHDTEAGDGYAGEEILRPRDAVTDAERSRREARDKDGEGFGANTESDAGPHTDTGRSVEDDTKSTQSQMNVMNHLGRDVSETLGSTTATDTFRGNEREVEDVQQHGTSSDVGVRGTGTNVELKQEIQGEDEEVEKEEEKGESMPNDGNSFETDVEAECEDLLLTYSEPPEKHRLDPVALGDEEPQSRDFQREQEEPSLKVLEAPDQTSTVPGSLRSRPSRLVEEGASGNIASAKLSTLKQESVCGEINADNTKQITHTSAQTQGDALSDSPSLKSLEGETAVKRDKGNGKEIKPPATDVSGGKSGPSHATDLKCKKEAQNDDDILREAIVVPLPPPPENSNVEEEEEEVERDADEEPGIEKGQMEAGGVEEKEKEETPGERKGREVSRPVDGSPREELEEGMEDVIDAAGEMVPFECIMPGAKVRVFAAGEIGQELARPEEVLNWKGDVRGSDGNTRGVSGCDDGSPGVTEENLTTDVSPATNYPEDPKCLAAVDQGIGHNLVTNERRDPTNVVEIVDFNDLQRDLNLNAPACSEQRLHEIPFGENNEPEITQSLAETTHTRQTPGQTPANSVPEERGLITEPCVSLRLRQAHATPEALHQPDPDTSDPRGQNPCGQSEDSTVGHAEKRGQSRARSQTETDRPNTPSCLTLLGAALLVLLFVAILPYGCPECFALYILCLCLFYFQWRRSQRSAMREESA